MSVSVRTRLQIAFNDFARIERYDDHVPGLHSGVRNAGRFDDDVPARAVDAADIAPGLDDETFGYELQVGCANLFFELVEHLSKLETSSKSKIRMTDCENETALRVG